MVTIQKIEKDEVLKFLLGEVFVKCQSDDNDAVLARLLNIVNDSE